METDCCRARRAVRRDESFFPAGLELEVVEGHLSRRWTIHFMQNQTLLYSLFGKEEEGEEEDEDLTMSIMRGGVPADTMRWSVKPSNSRQLERESR